MFNLPKFSYVDFYKANKPWFVALVLLFLVNAILISPLTGKSDGPDLVKLDRPNGVIYVHHIGIYVITLAMISLNIVLLLILTKAILHYAKLFVSMDRV